MTMSYDEKITGLRPVVRAGTLLPLATSCIDAPHISSDTLECLHTRRCR